MGEKMREAERGWWGEGREKEILIRITVYLIIIVLCMQVNLNHDSCTPINMHTIIYSCVCVFFHHFNI